VKVKSKENPVWRSVRKIQTDVPAECW